MQVAIFKLMLFLKCRIQEKEILVLHADLLSISLFFSPDNNYY